MASYSSDGSLPSKDMADESQSKKSPWETMDSDDAATPLTKERPPVAPNSSSRLMSLPPKLPPPVPSRGDDSSIGSHSSYIYINADGKKVRRVKKKRHGGGGSSTSSVASSSDDEITLGSMSGSISSIGSGVYIRADGKKVRRVKRSEKKKKQPDIPAHVSITSPTAPDTDTDDDVKSQSLTDNESSQPVSEAVIHNKEEEKVDPATLVEPKDLKEPPKEVMSEKKSTVESEKGKAGSTDSLKAPMESAAEEQTANLEVKKEEKVTERNPASGVAQEKVNNVPPTVIESKPVAPAAADSSDGGVFLIPVEPMNNPAPDPAAFPSAQQTSCSSSEKHQGKDVNDNIPLEQNADYQAAIDTIGVAALSAVQTANERNQPPNLNIQVAKKPFRHQSADLASTNTVGASSSDAVIPKRRNDQEENIMEGVCSKSAPQAPIATPKRRQLPEILNERTRSRADVDAFVTPRPPLPPIDPSRGQHMVRLDDDDEGLIMRTALAQKRVKVVQLLIFGLIGVAFGFLASFYVQHSCHFLTATVVVGDNAEEFDLHYGLWKYTPLNSAFDGYSYCYKYDSQYTAHSPIVPRIVGIVALLVGIYTLAVLWIYLVLGRTDLVQWKRAIYASAVSGIFQALTLLFFAGNVCRRNTCSVGPGAAVSIVSTLTWFVLAFEMHYNSPITLGDEHDEDTDGIMASLEMSDVGNGVTAFFRRITNANGHDMPTLNQIRRDKMETPSRGNGSYVPPHHGELA